MGPLIDRFINAFLALCVGAMTCVVLTGVTFRYVLNNPLPWPEELASLLFAWMTFVGAYVGVRHGNHISINTLVIFLPQGLRRAVARFAEMFVLVLLALFTYQGFRYTLRTWSLEFPAMEISRGYLYAALPIGAFLMMIGVALRWRLDRRGAPSTEAKP